MKNKEQIADMLVKETGITRRMALKIIRLITVYILENVRNGVKVRISSFGTFMSFTRASRCAANPQNPEETCIIPDVTVLKFRTGKETKDYLKNKIDTL